MQTSITGRHIELTDAIKDYVENKLKRLERHQHSLMNAEVILSVNKLVQKAEAKLDLDGFNIYAEAEDKDLYAAIDALTDKLDRQVHRHKEQLTDHQAIPSSRLQRGE